jgi:hypothetical protein
VEEYVAVTVWVPTDGVKVVSQLAVRRPVLTSVHGFGLKDPERFVENDTVPVGFWSGSKTVTFAVHVVVSPIVMLLGLHETLVEEWLAKATSPPPAAAVTSERTAMIRMRDRVRFMTLLRVAAPAPPRKP